MRQTTPHACILAGGTRLDREKPKRGCEVDINPRYSKRKRSEAKRQAEAVLDTTVRICQALDEQRERVRLRQEAASERHAARKARRNRGTHGKRNK